MFHLHCGNDIDGLAQRLASDLLPAGDSSLRDSTWSLRPNTILIPHPALGRWLQRRLTDRLGVLGNVEFLTPGEWLWPRLRAADDTLQAFAWNRPEVARWRLFKLLRRHWNQWSSTRPQLPGLLPNCTDKTLSWFVFADRMCRGFDRYQAYRRDWLRDFADALHENDWQASMWKALWDDQIRHSRANLMDAYFSNPSTQVHDANLPSQVFAFGCSMVSPDVLAVLLDFSKRMDLHFYLPQPCQSYWADVVSVRTAVRQGDWIALETENPLLADNATVGREFVEQLESFDAIDRIEHEFVLLAPNPATLLGQVQNDVLHRQRPELWPLAPASDDSLRLVACDSALTEVRQLHRDLHDLLDRRPDLQASDIAVLAPDLSAYARLIDAEFSLEPANGRGALPYQLNRKALPANQPIAAILDDFLRVDETDLAVDRVMSWFDLDAVQQRFGLSPMDVQVWRKRMADACILWGLDAQHRQQRGAGHHAQGSWQWGVDSLLLRQVMDGAKQVDIALEGQTSPHDPMWLALVQVMDALHQWRAWSKQTARMDGWQTRINEWLDRLFAPNRAEDHAALADIRTGLQTLAQAIEAAGAADEQLTLPVLRTALFEHLQMQNGDLPIAGPGITFARMVPMRLVPFKVIVLLGMDETQFPSRTPFDALNHIDRDRVAGKRRRGDRDTRLDDRFLFLQLLMAASDSFWLFFTALNDKSEAVAPSVCAQELAAVAKVYRPDWREENAAIARARSAPELPFELQASNLQLAPSLDSTRLTLEESPAGSSVLETRWSLQALVRALSDPMAHYLRNSLNIDLPRREIELSDEHWLEHGERWAIQQWQDEPKRRFTLEDPSGPDHSDALQTVAMPVQALFQAFPALTTHVPQRRVLHCALANGRSVMGELWLDEDGVYRRAYAHVPSARQWLYWVVESNLALASGEAQNAVLYALNASSQAIELRESKSKEAAQAQLQAFVELAARAACTLSWWFPKPAWQWAEASCKPDFDPARTWQKIIAAFQAEQDQSPRWRDAARLMWPFADSGPDWNTPEWRADFAVASETLFGEWARLWCGSNANVLVVAAADEESA